MKQRKQQGLNHQKDDLIRLFVVVYGIPVSTIDEVLDRLEAESLRSLQWLVISDDVRSLQSLINLWRERVKLITCIASPTSCWIDESISLLVRAEWSGDERDVLIWRVPNTTDSPITNAFTSMDVNALDEHAMAKEVSHRRKTELVWRLGKDLALRE